MSDWEEVAKVDEVKEGTCQVAEVDGTQVALINLDGAFYAIEDTCTHDGGEISCGIILGDEIICSRHGARFCIKTGKVTAAPAFENIATFPVKVEGDTIFCRDERWD